MNLCFVKNPQVVLTDPMQYYNFIENFGNDKKKKEIAKEFLTSDWHKLDPSMEEYINDSGDEEVITTSKGYNTEETKLFSFVFNAFVFMQVFNQINARKLEAGEFNVFSGMMANLPFLGIMVATILV